MEEQESVFDRLVAVAPPQPRVEPIIEPIEPKVEPKVEPKTFDLGVFKETFGIDAPDIDTVKGIIEKGSKYDEVEREKSTYQSRIAELEALENKIDPLSYFSSEDSFIREQFLLKSKDIKEEVLNEVSNLSPKKVDRLSDFEALKLDMFVKNPMIEGGKDAVIELIADKYGVSVEDLTEGGELDRLTKNKLKIDAEASRKSLKGMFDGIEVPAKADVAQTRETIKQAWSEPLNEIVKGIDKIKLGEGYEFIVTDDMKEGLYENTIQSLTNSLVKPSVEQGQKIAGELRSKLLEKNLDKVIKLVENQSMEKARAEYKAKVHNIQPLNNDLPPVPNEPFSFDSWLSKI